MSTQLAFNKVAGPLNFTNPGAISHNEMMELYRMYIDPSFQWCNISTGEQRLLVKAGRSNNVLDASKVRIDCNRNGGVLIDSLSQLIPIPTVLHSCNLSSPTF